MFAIRSSCFSQMSIVKLHGIPQLSPSCPLLTGKDQGEDGEAEEQEDEQEHHEMLEPLEPVDPAANPDRHRVKFSKEYKLS
ncbi:hypothetical protein Nepgr_014426 [Nepenthes gracilis]|uniref:Uncharacterized protein n=1 Tax=Nepenthes gracilis TaxID=150966 RepID=A0AAD3XQG4_NEPGR|nr:hypothetical protein Nepgr_014426 [Nepenthes gracilis]